MKNINHGIKFALIPENQYSDYRYDVIFNAYKWDPQVEDQNTVSKHVVLLDRETAEQLETWAEQLSEETMLMEEALIKNISLAKELGLPKKIYKELIRLKNYDRNQNVRLMRFDFHPITNINDHNDYNDYYDCHWAVSEVNSDVPGGLAEASVLPEIAKKYLDRSVTGEADYMPGVNTSEMLFSVFKDKINKNGVIAFVHATSYADDRQVMQFLSDDFNNRGIDTIFAAPDHLKWIGKKAVSVIEGRNCDIEGIIRFFPLEWLVSLPNKSNWTGYYDCETVSCNHPVAIFAQSKRLPLIWDQLNVEIPAWKKLLPETKDPKSIKIQTGEWLYKPVLGRVGEGITVKNTMPEKEFIKIEKEIRKYSIDWIAQHKFESRPLALDTNSYHLCLGVFTVNGKRAGFYGRINPYPLIDSKAKDIPVFISKT